MQSGEAERLEPLPLQHFLSYADWFQRSFVPESDPARRRPDRARRRRRARHDAAGRRGAGARRGARARRHAVPARAVRARRAATTRACASCSSAAATTICAGKRVVVIGAGNNGVESALLALRAEAAGVELIVRSRVRWFAEREPHTPRGALRQRLYRHRLPGRRLRAAADQPLRAAPRRVRAAAARAARAPQRAPAAPGRRSLAAPARRRRDPDQRGRRGAERRLAHGRRSCSL